MPEVVVVGGGVIGCATAYYLAREGADVTLLEREGLAGEGEWYELRALMTDGSFTTIEKGRLNVQQSLVDTP